MILIDTSAWIEFFRRQGSAACKARVAAVVGAGTAAHTCPVRFELLLGARPEETRDIQAGLDFSTRVRLEAEDWDQAAALGARLRAAGVTVPASDLLIAVVAVRHDLPLLARDSHFARIRDTVLPALRLIPC